MSAASKARKEAKKTVKRLGNVKSPNKAQQRKLDAAEETVRTATIAIQAQKETAGKSLEELREMREESMADRAGLKGQGKFDEALQARAYADAMRAETGRQQGQGTPYVGPGGRIYLDEEGHREDEAGRVLYDVDPGAYEKRFRPTFVPTQEQIDMAGGPGAWEQGLLSGGADSTYLTPWQQTNFQQMLRYGADDPTQYQLNRMVGPEGTTDTSRIPKSLRTDWRTNVWGGLLDPETGRWSIDDPEERATQVAEQLRRYEAGEFNPYTGQPIGSTGPEPWPGMGVTPPWRPPVTGGGGGGGGPGTGGGGGGAYTPMAAQDWSGIMPQGVFAGSAVQPTQAMQGLVAQQGLQYQPWAMPEDTVAGSPFVSQNVQYNAPLNYSAVGGDTTTSADGTTTNGDTTATQLQDWQNPQFNARTGKWMPTGFGSSLEWYNSLLTPAEQLQGAQSLFKTGRTGLDLEPKNFVNPYLQTDASNPLVVGDTFVDIPGTLGYTGPPR
jgi:hypothetical protein